MEEAKGKQETILRPPLQSYPSKGEEMDFLFECEVAQLEIEACCPVIKEPSSPGDAGKIETLTAEVQHLEVVKIELKAL